MASPQESLASKKKALASLSSSHDLFSSLEEDRLQVGMVDSTCDVDFERCEENTIFYGVKARG